MRLSLSARARAPLLAVSALLVLLMTAPPGRAGDFLGKPDFVWDLELMSLSLTGGPYLMPLVSDPGNALGDSIDGYGFLMAGIALNESASLASLGQAMAFDLRGENGGTGGDEVFFVDSFFDVFFDITITDVDNRPGRDLPGAPPGIGGMWALNGVGPAHMESQYTAVADPALPNMGLIPPPEEAPYIGHIDIEIPLGIDINGNGENDKIKFTLATHQVGGQQRSFIILPDGTVVDHFNSEAFLEGAVVDESTDPPFQIGINPLTGQPAGNPPLVGPASVHSAPVVPEPSTYVLFGLGLGLIALMRRRRRGG